MTKREVRRIALLIAWDDLSRSLDTSDEWTRHPETDIAFTVQETEQIKREAKVFLDALEVRIARFNQRPRRVSRP